MITFTCLYQTKGLSWAVPTGRLDGRVSLASDTSNLPGFTDSVDVQKKKFADKGLDTQDLVALVGKKPLIHHSTLHAFNTCVYISLTKTSCAHSRWTYNWDFSLSVLQIQALQLHHNWKWC